MKKTSIYKFIVLTLSIFMLSACGKSTQEDLKSHEWSFNATKGEKLSYTAKFSEKSLVLSVGSISTNFQYEISNKSGKEEIKFTNKDDDTTEIRTFNIRKNSDEYKLQPTNKLAKEDTGEITLIPK